jgi:plasmid stabilization system protein ParE
MPKRHIEITPSTEADIRAICADIALGSTLATATRRRNITESAWGTIRTASRDGRAPAWIFDLMCEARRLATLRRSPSTTALLIQIEIRELPSPVMEFAPLPGRKYRADLAWPSQRLICEIQGGSWAGGRHTSGAGYAKDRARTNDLTCAGWRVIEVTPRHIRTGEAIAWIAALLEGGAR